MNAPAAPPAPPPRRGLRRLGKALAVVLLGAAVLAVALYAAAGPLLGAALERAGTELLGVPVEVSAVRLRLAGGLQTGGLSVGNPEGFDDPDAFRCAGLAVRTPLTALLRNPVQVHELAVLRPEVTLELAPRPVEGKKANWSVLVGRLQEAGRKVKEKAPEPVKQREFVLERIRITEPRLRFRAPVVAPEGVVLAFNDIALDRVGSAPGTRSTSSVVLAAVMQAIFGGQAKEDGLPGPLRSSIRGELREAAGAFGELLDGQ